MVRTSVLVLACWSTVALAAQDFDTYLSSAATLHEALDYDQALVALERAKAAASTPHELATVALWRGVVLSDRNELDAADRAFTEGLSIELDAQLPTAAAPKIRRRFEALRASLRKVAPPPRQSPEPAAPVPAPVEAVSQATPPSSRARPLAIAFTTVAVLSGAASLGLRLACEQQVGVANGAAYMFDAERAAHGAATFANASLGLVIVAGAFALSALIAWLL